MNSIEKVKNSLSSFVGHLLKELEIVKNDGIVYGVIPCSSDSPSILPRAKPIPAQKMETRWERFAKEKGIQKVKKKRVVWDEERGAYLPTFGYRNQGAAAKDKDLSEWIHEIKDDQDPSVDVVAEKRADKKDRVRKNEMQQRRNLEEGAAKVAGIDYRALRKDELRRRLGDAKRANASMGRFDSVQDGVKLKSGKRKFEAVTKSADTERSQSLALLDKMERQKSVVGVSKKAAHLLGRDEKKAVARKMAEGTRGSKKMAPKSGKKKRKM